MTQPIRLSSNDWKTMKREDLQTCYEGLLKRHDAKAEKLDTLVDEHRAQVDAMRRLMKSIAKNADASRWALERKLQDTRAAYDNLLGEWARMQYPPEEEDPC